MRYYARRGGPDLRVIQVFRTDGTRYESWVPERWAWAPVSGEALSRYMEEQLTVDEVTACELPRPEVRS